MMQVMDMQHYYRSIIVAALGLLTVLMSIAGITIILRSTVPDTLSLAYRIKRNQTLFFVRTTDASSFIRSIAAISPPEVMRSLPSALSKAQSISYEFALLRKDNDSPLHWILSLRGKDQRQKIVSSDQSQALLLPPENIGESLGTAPSFRTLSVRRATNLSFLSTDIIPLLPKNTSSIVQSLLTPFSEALALWDEDSVTVTLQKQEKEYLKMSQASITPPLLGTGALFEVAMHDPKTLLTTFARNLMKIDPTLAEGIKGILQANLEEATKRSDLHQAMSDFLSDSARLSIASHDRSVSMMLLGTARSSASLQNWIQSAKTVGASARIRTQLFPHGNIRTDIIATMPEDADEQVDGWSITMINATGSALPLTIGTKGEQFILSHDPILIRQSIHEDTLRKEITLQNTYSIVGSIDTAWLLQKKKQVPSFLQQDLDMIDRFLQTEKRSHLHFAVEDLGSSVNVQLEMIPEQVTEHRVHSR